jgi:hypothetical protein
MVGSGVPEPAARVLASFAIAARERLLDTVTSAVEDLTGKPPASLREIVSQARRTRSRSETVSRAA